MSVLPRRPRKAVTYQAQADSCPGRPAVSMRMPRATYMDLDDNEPLVAAEVVTICTVLVMVDTVGAGVGWR